MNIWTPSDGKRAVREFADRPIEPELLERIVRAGTRAHSSKNQQRWDFVVVQDRARLAALSTTGRYAGHVAGAAAAIALVTPDPRAGGQPLSVMWDLGGAAAQMMLAAWDAGIGTARRRSTSSRCVREILRLPDDAWCEYVLSFGYPADPATLTAPLRTGGRRPIDEVVHHETWEG